MGETSHIKGLDENFRWRKGYLYCFSGYPQSGKSEILNYLSILRAYHYGDKVMMYSPETNTAELVLNLCQAYLGKNVNPNYADKCSEDEMNKASATISLFAIFSFSNSSCGFVSSPDVALSPQICTTRQSRFTASSSRSFFWRASLFCF